MPINGLEPDSQTGKIKATYLTSLPDWYQTGSWKEPESNKWYWALLKYLNGPPGNNDTTKTPKITAAYLWDTRDQAVPPDSPGGLSWGSAVIAALSEFVVPSQAAAIAQWLGGAYQYKGTFGGLSKSAYDMADFLDAKSCYGYENPTVRISDALSALKSQNKAAHDWVVRAASAKAAKKAAHEAVMYQKTIDAELNIVAKIPDAAGKAIDSTVTGVTDSLSVGAFLLKNIWWVAPIGIVGFIYIKYKIEKSILGIGK